MIIRPFHEGEQDALRAVFHASVHGLASANYTLEQIRAWAPEEYDKVIWAQRLRENQPFVAEVDCALAGFADLQPSGYIDQFFVAPRHARRGVASALMERLLESARERQIEVAFSNVSLTAEPFFAKYGFLVERRNEVHVRGAILHNATMRLQLSSIPLS